MPSALLTLILLLIAASAVAFIIHRRRHGVTLLNVEDPVERRRGHRQAIGPDGKALLLGRAVRPSPPPTPDPAAPAAPGIVQPRAQPQSRRATRISVRRDRAGGISIELQGQTFTTPLWGRAPRDAARDLYRYAIYATRLDSATARGQH